NCTHLWFELSQNQFEQSTLAGAIGAHQANAIATHNQAGEVTHYVLVWKAVAYLFQLRHQLARIVARGDRKLGLADQFTSLGTSLPQGFKCSHTPLVAGAAGLDALPYPDLFPGQLFIEQGVVPGLLGQGLLSVVQVAAIVPGPGA